MTVQPDETFSEVLPGAPTTRRTFTSSDTLALYAEIYAQAGQIAQRVDVTTRLISESGREISVARDELSGTNAAREPFASYSFSKTVPLRDVAPGAYLLRVEAQRRGDPDRIVARETAIRVAAE